MDKETREILKEHLMLDEIRKRIAQLSGQATRSKNVTDQVIINEIIGQLKVDIDIYLNNISLDMAEVGRPRYNYEQEARAIRSD